MPRTLSQAAWRWLFGLLLVSLLTPPLQADDSGTLRYPRRADGDEFRSIYALAQLQLALDKAGSALRLEPSHYSMEQERALVNLEHNDRLDVAWSMTSHEREQRLLPVRIPLDKGLFGWRIALLPKDRAQLLKNVRNLDDLRQFWGLGSNGAESALKPSAYPQTFVVSGGFGKTIVLLNLSRRVAQVNERRR